MLDKINLLLMRPSFHRFFFSNRISDKIVFVKSDETCDIILGRKTLGGYNEIYVVANAPIDPWSRPNIVYRFVVT